MKILKYSLGQLQANCYFLIKEENCLVIDPADEADFILEALRRHKLHLVGVLATHGHFGHVMAAGEIQRSYPVLFYINKKDLFLVNRLNQTAEYFLKHNPYCLKPIKTRYLKEGKFQISNFKFEIINTPGHTPGGCCFYFEEEKIVFTGDILFKEGIGRYDFSYSNKEDLRESIKKILKLPKKTIIYPGHGDSTTISFVHF